MLSREQQVEGDLWKYRNGMLNATWLVGVARDIDKREGKIQQTNNLNHMIPFHLSEGDSMPSRVAEKRTIKIIGRLGSEKIGDEHSVVLRALSIETPSIIDLPPRRFWNQVLREGIPQDDVRPEAFADESVEAMVGGRLNASSGNTVRLAGFVASYRLQRAGAKKDNGDVSNGALLLLLRQTKDESDLLPVMLYGRLAEAHANRINIADPLVIDGRLRIDAKPTGEPAGPGGIIPVKRRLYIQADKISSVTFGEEIKAVPEWAKELYRSVNKAPGRRPAAGAARGRSDGKFSVGTAPAEAVAPPQSAPVATAPSTDLDSERRLMEGINPDLLRSLNP